MLKDEFTNLGDLHKRISNDDKNIIEKYLSSYPVKLVALADELGLSLFKSTLPPSISGLIQPSGISRSGFEIKINKFEPNYRQRFTLAHEIGHFLLHREMIASGITDSIMYRSTLSSQKEVEANKFASWLLMPYSLVKQASSLLSEVDVEKKVEMMAEQFKVSKDAMKFRLGV